MNLGCIMRRDPSKLPEPQPVPEEQMGMGELGQWPGFGPRLAPVGEGYTEILVLP